LYKSSLQEAHEHTQSKHSQTHKNMPEMRMQVCRSLQIIYKYDLLNPPTKKSNYEFIISKHRAWTESRQAKETARKAKFWGLGN
jgi:hypothetical protein